MKLHYGYHPLSIKWTQRLYCELSYFSARFSFFRADNSSSADEVAAPSIGLCSSFVLGSRAGLGARKKEGGCRDMAEILCSAHLENRETKMGIN